MLLLYTLSTTNLEAFFMKQKEVEIIKIINDSHALLKFYGNTKSFSLIKICYKLVVRQNLCEKCYVPISRFS